MTIKYIETTAGRRIAHVMRAGLAPTVMFMGGFRSDMTGTKATALEEWAVAQGRGFVRFDYSGHGASSGRFEEGTIGDWLADVLAIIDAKTRGPLILVGSSMGGWIALLAALARPERIAGLVLIAPAPDFTERLMWANFDADMRARLLREGCLELASEYDDAPLVITRCLIEEGRAHLLLEGDEPIAIAAPVRILHGMRDRDVPWELSRELVERLAGTDVVLELVRDGDHRLSRGADLKRLLRRVEEVIEASAAPGEQG